MTSPTVVKFHATMRPISICICCNKLIPGHPDVTVLRESGEPEDYCAPCYQDTQLLVPST